MFIRELRLKKNLTLNEVAKKMGITIANLSLIETGKVQLTLENLNKLKKIFNCSASEILGEKEITINNNDIVYIKYYDVIASAGPGFLNSTENSKLIPFDKSYLEDLGIFKRNSYSDIVILKVNGMSMFPTINNNDIIFIDINKKEINSNKIYVINENGLIKVKRIVKTNPFSENIEIKSDNTISNDYPTYSLSLLDIDLNQLIVGQVVAIVKKIID